MRFTRSFWFGSAWLGGASCVVFIFAATSSAAGLDAVVLEKVDRWLDRAPFEFKHPEERQNFKTLIVLNSSPDMFRCIVRVAHLKGQRAILKQEAPGADIPESDDVFRLPMNSDGVSQCEDLLANLKEQVTILAKK